ncbi:MAG: SMP-30/gluconolactonase/LRE family protein, partial [Bosea sp. (in: a-proteobacteria)]
MSTASAIVPAPSSDAKLTLDQLSFLGSGLSRPECLVTHRSGLIFAADWTGTGGVSIISTDGTVRRRLAREAGKILRPNGIALEPGGSFLIAHLGADDGGLFRLHPDGRVEDVALHIAGVAIPPSNFALVDSRSRIWLTVSTRVSPRADDYRPTAQTGFIALIENGVARIVADDLGYANECTLSADEKYLFVNETFARRLTRFDVEDNGNLSNRTTLATFGPGTFPDGVVLDADGAAWITSIVSNRVLKVASNGTISTVLEDADPQHLDHVEQAFQSASMGRRHLDGVRSKVLRNVSSLAFGGTGMRTAYLGCLLDDRIPFFEVSATGVSPRHFDFDLG